MGALLAVIPLVQLIGLAISGFGVIVPEIDRVAVRHLNGGQCYAITFSRDRSTAIMRPTAICHDEGKLAVKGYQLAGNGNRFSR